MISFVFSFVLNCVIRIMWVVADFVWQRDLLHGLLSDAAKTATLISHGVARGVPICKVVANPLNGQHEMETPE